MQALFYRSLVLVILLCSAQVTYAQLKIVVGELFAPNVTVKKLHICVEDHSVWLLNDAGKILVKKSSDTQFSLFPATALLTVKAMTGYKINEMYFVVGDQILSVQNGNQNLLTVPFPGVSRINDIAVYYGKEEENYTQQTLDYKDYLSIATNNDLYYLIRGNNAITEKYTPRSPYYYPDIDFQIGYAGFKHQNYRYLHPSSFCGVEGYRENTDFIDGLHYWSAIPEKAPYSGNVTSSFLATHNYQPFERGWSLYYNIWSTDDGIYSRVQNSCISYETKKHLAGEHVNTLENIYALTAIRKQDFVLAGSNTGIFYTKKSIFPEMFSSPSLDLQQFERLTDFPRIKVNVLKTETAVQNVYKAHRERHYAVCEKIVWAATDKGVYRLYLSLDQEYYNTILWNDVRFSMTPSNGNFEDPIFNLCGDQSVTITADTPPTFNNQILFQWFKDGVEIPELIGKMEATFSSSGIYTAKITSLCERITINSKPFKIINNLVPDITFNYPPVMTVCEGGSFVLSTQLDPSYYYRWFRDGIQLPGEIQNTYTARIEGNYHVEVSNCLGVFKPSSSTKLIIGALPKPVITSNKAVYCENDVADLSISNPQGYEIRWDYSGSELPQFKNQTSIIPPGDGEYVATFINTEGCTVQSDVFKFVVHTAPTANITRSSNRNLCYGESVVLTADNTDGATYLWSNGANTRAIKVEQSGNYSVRIISAQGCVTVSDNVRVVIGDRLILTKPANIQLCKIKGEKVVLKADEGFLSYIWNGKRSYSNTLTVDATGSYTLTVEDVNGCTASTVFNVEPGCNSITAPNAFSPNGDGSNDIWQVSGLEDDPQATISIYNIYGAIVHTISGKYPSWDGKHRGAMLPVGTYYYVLRTKLSQKPVNGSITLVR